MKITCDRETFLGAFQTAASVAPVRSPKPILQNVKLIAEAEGVTLIATDLEVGIRVTAANVEVEQPGTAVLPLTKFSAILRESSDEKLRLDADAQGIVVRGQQSEFNLQAQNPDEFPQVTEFTEEKYHEVPARLLREMIRRTVFATDNESTRYALGGVLLELSDKEIVAVGTDGRRLARMQGPAQSIGGHQTGENTTIVPTKAMQLMERALTDGDAEICLAVRPNDVLVKSNRMTIYSRLVEGRFPRWRDVIPDKADSTQIDLVVGPLHAAVRQAQITTDEDSRGVDFHFGEGKLVLTGRAQNVGQARVELPIPYESDKSITVTLDPKFVSEFLKVLDPQKTFSLHLTDHDGPVVGYTDDGYAYVIMPLARDKT